MDLAKVVVSGLLGFVAAVASYPYFDEYVVSLLAFAGAVAVGVLVFGVVKYLLDRYLPTSR